MNKFREIKLFSTYIDSNIKDDFILNLEMDSRKCDNTKSFLAITGEKFNALSFLKQVTNNNAKCFIYEDKDQNEELVKNYKDDNLWIKVKDTVSFLQEFSRLISDKIKDNGGHVISISGSNGKTTTREMLYHLLSSINDNCITTQKNNNNHIGVPLTLLQANDKTEIAIVELGSNHPGEIKILCDASSPNLAVTTNIGHTHLEFFEGLQAVFKEESYPCEHILKNDGIFFLNSDDEYLKTLNITKQVKSFGYNSSDINFTFDKNLLTINYDSKIFSISNGNITGQHNFFNLGVAFILSLQVNREREEDLLKACQSFSPTINRSEWRQIEDTKIFLDAYNANPSSMIASLEGFKSSLPKDAKPLYILGDMNELGQLTEKLHFDTAKKCSELGVSDITFIGQYSKGFKEGFSGTLTVLNSTDEYKNNLKNYTHVFIKGSRSLQLERILDIT